MNSSIWLQHYLRSRTRRPAPVWSTIWGQLGTEYADQFVTDIRWPKYISPFDIKIEPLGQRPEAMALLEKARLRQEADARQKAIWMEENTLDATPYVEKWDVTADEVCTQLLDIAVGTFPMMDGLGKVNETIKYAFEMKDAEIDPAEFSAIITSLFRMQVFQWAVKRAFPDDTELQSTVMQRVAARELPTKDNMAEKRSNANVEAAIRELAAGQKNEIRRPAPHHFDPLHSKEKRQLKRAKRDAL